MTAVTRSQVGEAGPGEQRRSCSQPESAVPAGINGAYMLATAQHAHNDVQSAFWIQRGLTLLTVARAPGRHNPSVSAVDDDMRPRFSLQAQVRVR